MCVCVIGEVRVAHEEEVRKMQAAHKEDVRRIQAEVGFVMFKLSNIEPFY